MVHIHYDCVARHLCCASCSVLHTWWLVGSILAFCQLGATDVGLIGCVGLWVVWQKGWVHKR